MSKTKPFIWLIIIATVGLVLRTAFFGAVPPSPDWDEVSLGYNAYSLLHTGRDEWGVALPIIFRAFGDYKLPVYAYLAVASQALLGLNLFATRLPSLVAGMGLIIVAFALGRKVAGNFGGLLPALLVAVSPWTVFLSRVGLEANVCAFLVAGGIYYLASGKLSRAVLLLGLSVWTYNSARIFTPLFLIVYWWLNRKSIRLSPATIGLGVVLFVPMIWQLVNPIGQARYQWLSLLDSGAIQQINSLRGKSSLSPTLARLTYNKVTYLSVNVVANYLSYLGPNFLFLKGGSHYQLSVPHTGLLYWVSLPLFYLGIFLLVKYPTKFNRLLLLWLLLSPVAGSITRDSPHTTRAIVMLPLPMLLSALGLNYLVTKFNRKTVILAVFGVGLCVGGEQYVAALRSYQTQYSWAWQYGYEQVVQFIKQRYNLYDQVIFTKRYGEPHEYVLYFWPWDPAAYRLDPNLDRYFRSNWYWVDSFAKFRFVNDWEMPNYVAGLPSGRYLVVSSPDNQPSGREVNRVNFLDGRPAFIMQEIP